jgi:hypothetical protein
MNSKIVHPWAGLGVSISTRNIVSSLKSKQLQENKPIPPSLKVEDRRNSRRDDHMIDVMAGAKSGPVSRFDAQARSTALRLLPYYFAGFILLGCTHILYTSNIGYRLERPRTRGSSKCRTNGLPRRGMVSVYVKNASIRFLAAFKLHLRCFSSTP